MSNDPSELDRPPTEGTHPLPLMALAGAIAGLVTSSCICIYPPLAPVLPAMCGLPAVGVALFTFARVKSGKWSPDNRVQAKWALILGSVDVLLAIGWAALLWSRGASLGLDL